MLPDDLLLEIFDFCVDENENEIEGLEAWQTLVHACRRWRTGVFGSPRRLSLRLVCADETPARDTLDVWPALPLVLWCSFSLKKVKMDNIVAVLERNNRVCQISLSGISSSDLENISAAMQVPFPELTSLQLWSDDEIYETAAVLPELFLGGSAPRLRFLYLCGIPFPGLPNLLLSATHLVTLLLCDIPHSGYFSPEAMVAALSTMTCLEELTLQFQSPLSHPDPASRRPPPPTRFVVPVLRYFEFKGVSECLDYLVARIDAPRIFLLVVTFFNQIVFDTPHLAQFISRIPRLKLLDTADVIFNAGASSVKLTGTSRTNGAAGSGNLEVKIQCRELDWQVSSVEQVCTSCLPPLSILEDLYITAEPYWQPYWQDNVENALWLELLRPFTAVKNLHLSDEFARRIVPALQELVGSRTTEILPALENIFLDGLEPSGLVQEGIDRFVATRLVTSHPIGVTRWDRSSPSDIVSPLYSGISLSDRGKDRVPIGRRLINALRLLPR